MKRCVFGLFLGLIVLFATISPNFIAQAEGIENGTPENVVQSVTFLANGEPVSNGDTISLEDEFQVEYRLVSPLYMNYEEDDKEEGHVYLSEGDVIELPEIMSTAFDLSKIGEFACNLDDGTNFGTVSVSSSGQVSLKINYSENKNVNDVVVGIKFGLNSKVVEDKQQYTFQIPGIEPKTVVVNLDDNDPLDPEPTDPEDVTQLTKAGGVINSDGVASWEIKLTNYNADLADVYLYDYFKVDNGTDIELLTDSVVVKDEAGNVLEEGTDYKLSYNKGRVGTSTGGQNYSWKLYFGEMSAEKQYTVSYDTKINDYEKFILENHRVPVNQAWVEYNKLTGGDEPVFVKSPTVEKWCKSEEVIVNSVIEKYPMSTDPAKHQITWQIAINKKCRHFTNVSVLEQICSGQKLVSFGKVKIYDSNWNAIPCDIQPVEVEEGLYRFDFGDSLDGYQAKINVVTELTESEISSWEANNDKIYYNKVILNSDQHDNVVFTAQTKCKWDESVLTKSGKIDKTTNKVDYTVVINAGQQTLPERVEIKDELGKSLTFDQESVKLYRGIVNSSTKKVTAGELIQEGYTQSIKEDGENEVLTIIFPKLTDNKSAYVLTYTAIPKEIVRDGDYTNSIQLLGYGEEEIQRVEEEMSFNNFGGGWAEDPTKPNKPTPTPTPTPTPSTPSSSNTSSGSGSSNGGSSDVVGYGETVISIGSNNLDGTTIADENVPLAGSPVLAKTGGFIGTLSAYGAGIILVIVGFAIAFGGRKKSGNEK